MISFCFRKVGIKDRVAGRERASVVLNQGGSTPTPLSGCLKPRRHFPFFFKYNFMHYLFWLHWVFVAACRLSSIAVLELLIVVASLVAEHSF